VNAAALVDIAIAVLPLARSDEELDEWWKANQSWIPDIKASAPAEYSRLIEAGKAHRKALSREAGSLGARRIGGSSDRWSQQPRQDGS
jgi:hypothetical protein